MPSALVARHPRAAPVEIHCVERRGATDERAVLLGAAKGEVRDDSRDPDATDSLPRAHSDLHHLDPDPP
jgi:hypothetical protein